MSKKIAVLGAGANGASIGADLTRAGLEVVLIDQWPEHVAAMRRRGIRVEMPGSTIETPVRAHNLCDICTFREKFDVVLMLMKAYDSRWASWLIEPYLKPNGLLVGVQNGMTVDVIADVVGPSRTLGCVVEISSAMFDPGVVTRDLSHARSWFAVGSISAATKGRENEIADLLHYSGKVEIVENIRATKWMKLVSNATTLVSTALLGVSIQEAATIPAMRNLMLRSGQEALEVGAALGHPVLPIFGLKEADLRKSNWLVEMLLDVLLDGFTLPTTKTTVLQDWMKGRRSETDDLNGFVAAEGKRLGVRTPVNAAIVELAHRIEMGALTAAPENLGLFADLARAHCI